jgi:hypothetical protein
MACARCCQLPPSVVLRLRNPTVDAITWDTAIDLAVCPANQEYEALSDEKKKTKVGHNPAERDGVIKVDYENALQQGQRGADESILINQSTTITTNIRYLWHVAALGREQDGMFVRHEADAATIGCP